MVTEMETAFNTFKKSFKYTLRHFHEVYKMFEQFTFKTFNNECKKKIYIYFYFTTGNT